MKRLLVCFTAGLVIFCISLSGCSKNESMEPEKGKIEKMTDRAADMAVKNILTPINQARSVKDVEESRMRSLDETLKQ